MPASWPDRAPVTAHASSTNEQRLVDAHFDATASRWQALYDDSALSTLVYRHRQSLALSWISGLQLPVGTRVLEVGCGASATAVMLASLGFTVTAMDRLPAMLDRTRRQGAEAGISDRLSTVLGDVHALEFDDESFTLVLALGVLPWLHAPDRALEEMTRVLQPGGYVLASADNRAALTGFLEPLENPLLHPAKEALKRALQAGRLKRRTAGRNRPLRRHQLQRRLMSLGLEVISWTTFGFGPFTAFRRPLLPKGLGAKVYHGFQGLADRRYPGLRSAGAQHLFLARKPLGRGTVPSR